MRFINSKVFRAIFFMILLNFENIIIGNFPSLFALLIQFLFIVIFLYIFLPTSYEKSTFKTNIFLRYKVISIIFLIFILNLEQLVSNGKIPVVNLIFSVLVSFFLVYYLLPRWYINDTIDKK